MAAKSTRPPKPTKEQLAKVEPWITATVRRWQMDNLDYDDEYDVDGALEQVFGKRSPKKPAARDLKAVQAWAVDQVVRWGRDQGVCEELDRVLALVFSAPADGHFRDSDGFDCKGVGPSGYDVDGYDRGGFNADGWNNKGYGRDGLDKDGFDVWGRHRATGLTREQWANEPVNLAIIIKRQGPEFAAAVKASLGDPVDAD